MSHELFEAAREAMTKAYAPYSKFPVGVALKADDGQVYLGANIENLSFPQGWCAEPTAIGAITASRPPQPTSINPCGSGAGVSTTAPTACSGSAKAR